MLFQYIHIIFLLMMPSILLSAPVLPAAKHPHNMMLPPLQHDAATPVLHGWDGVLRLASFPIFPPNITMVIMAKQLYFCFIRPEDISLKSMIFVCMLLWVRAGGREVRRRRMNLV
jgi:hypothetical protein